MAHYRTRKETISYKKYLHERKKQGKDSDCIFCEVVPGFPQFVKELKHFKIIRNIFMYSSWDGQAVREHLLLVPLRLLLSSTLTPSLLTKKKATTCTPGDLAPPPRPSFISILIL